MEKMIKEIGKELNWKEKIILKIFKKKFIMFYRKGMADCFNFYNKI